MLKKNTMMLAKILKTFRKCSIEINGYPTRNDTTTILYTKINILNI